MARDLDGVIRYRKHIVDEKRRALGELLRQEDYLIQAREMLERQMREEAAIAAADSRGAGLGYGLYVARAHQRRDQIAAALAETRRRVEQAQDEVRESFKELKTFEIAQESRDTRERAERDHKEQQSLDEIGLELHRRRAAKPGG